MTELRPLAFSVWRCEGKEGRSGGEHVFLMRDCHHGFILVAYCRGEQHYALGSCWRRYGQCGQVWAGNAIELLSSTCMHANRPLIDTHTCMHIVQYRLCAWYTNEPVTENGPQIAVDDSLPVSGRGRGRSPQSRVSSSPGLHQWLY